jgi:hypothetical protein
MCAGDVLIRERCAAGSTQVNSLPKTASSGHAETRFFLETGRHSSAPIRARSKSPAALPAEVILDRKASEAPASRSTMAQKNAPCNRHSDSVYLRFVNNSRFLPAGRVFSSADGCLSLHGMNSNVIPKSFPDVTNLAALALGGALAHGDSIGLLHNSKERLAADFYAVTGDPANSSMSGRQAMLDAQLRAMRTTQEALDSVREPARNFCHMGIGILKPLLGHRWNGDWLAAGFTARSLSVPRVPLSLLVEFRVYLEANPGMESASLGFTAAHAQAHLDAVVAATQARDTAKGARWSVKAARDAAFRALRKRLSNLRTELAQLLAPTDDRWYAFGFRRPADGRIPEVVQDVTATEVAQGTVQVAWSPSKRADSYRVTVRVADSDAPPLVEAIVADHSRIITGVPDGVPLVISVSARNRSGETRATQVVLQRSGLVAAPGIVAN